jgi:hypothetical protein
MLMYSPRSSDVAANLTKKTGEQKVHCFDSWKCKNTDLCEVGF